jgi:hypothetical protein
MPPVTGDRPVALFEQPQQEAGAVVALLRPAPGGIVERPSHLVGLGDDVAATSGGHG